MRGRESSDRRMLPTAPGDQARAAAGLRPDALIDDLVDLPVSAAELDAIEAFLLPQLLAVLNEGDNTEKADSKTPQKPAKVLTLSGALP